MIVLRGKGTIAIRLKHESAANRRKRPGSLLEHHVRRGLKNLNYLVQGAENRCAYLFGLIMYNDYEAYGIAEV